MTDLVQHQAAEFSKCRSFVVEGDGMAPTFRAHRDVLIVAPCAGYVGEGIYVIDNGIGEDVYRVQSAGARRELSLARDNKAYPTHILTLVDFERACSGKVIGRVEIIDRKNWENFCAR